LGVDFSAKNIVVAETKGGRYAERTAPIRIDALEAASGESPVPHVIVVDRDERSQSAVDDLKEKLGDRVHVLERRELENYMLSVPAAIRAALLSKHQQDTAMVASIDGVSDIEMERRITEAVDSLFDLTLAKRLRWALGGFPGGLVDDETLEREVVDANSTVLADRLNDVARQRFGVHLHNMELTALVERERTQLENEWENQSRRINIVPGADVLERVYQSFNSRYDKSKDGLRIAAAMNSDDIPEEIQEIIEKIAKKSGN
jgi:hypothetical protein